MSPHSNLRVIRLTDDFKRLSMRGCWDHTQDKKASLQMPKAIRLTDDFKRLAMRG